MNTSEILAILEEESLEEGFLDTISATMRGWEQSNNNSYNKVVGRESENEDPSKSKEDRYIEHMVEKLIGRFEKTMTKMQNINNKELDKDLKRLFKNDEDAIKRVGDSIQRDVGYYIYKNYFSDSIEEFHKS